MSPMVNLRILIWTVIPNHYQASFHDALRSAGIDLRVCYYEQVHAERLAMGWDEFNQLPKGEMFVSKSMEAFESVQDWRERIHVVPGYGNRFLRKLASGLSASGAEWVHWNEPARPGLRWYATYPVKKWYANLVNRYALGAFGIGNRALHDLEGWGIRTERISLLPYSSPVYDCEATPDEICTDFCKGRQAFLFLGSLNYRKGIDLLLSAFASATQDNTDSVLVLVGNDLSGGAYARQAKELGISDRVLFRGPVAPSHLANILACCKILVLPSRWDGWGVVLNEAASSGLAIIGSDRAGASYHLVEPGKNGFRVKSGDIYSLTNAMKAYVNDPDLAEIHGKNSLELFAQYTPQQNVQRFINTIRTWQAMG